ncbi:ATP-grasp domain-containing protein [Streptomyces sp. NPDC002784]
MNTRHTFDVAYITYDGDDPDRLAVLQALQGEGLTAKAVRWSDDDVDWADHRVALLRSAWDYPAYREDFLQRMRTADRECLLMNPLAVLEWNTDKQYLRTLQEQGVPVVPTNWLTADPGLTDIEAGSAIPDGPQDVVVKPSIGAGGRHCLRTGDRARARAYAASLARRGDHVLIQPYMESVEDEGETSLMYIGGTFSHAIRRSGSYLGPETQVPDLMVPGGDDVGPIQTHQPSDDQLKVAESALAAVPGHAADLVYARIDLIPDATGRPCVTELELAEPFLFLNHSPNGAHSLARVVSRALRAMA